MENRHELRVTTRPDPTPGGFEAIPPDSDFQELVDDFKLALVHRALRQAGGNHRRAAALIGVHRSSFTRMLHRLEGARRARQSASIERKPQPSFTSPPPGIG